MKYLYFSLFIFSLISVSFGTSFAAQNDCEVKKGYDFYTCQSKQICEKYDSKKPVWRGEAYKDALSYKDASQGLELKAFDTAKATYRTNIGNIYKCALLTSQKTSLTQFKDRLITLDKTGVLKDRMGKQIEKQLQKIDISSQSIGCQDIGNTQIYNKLNILQESTLEMCRYTTYLEYLREFYSELPNLVSGGGTHEGVEYTNEYIGALFSSIDTKIQNEREHSFKVLPIAFHAYEEYENNLPVHLLLQIIKEDYIIIREKMAKAFNPISQVVYKISNAMQK